MFSVVRRRSKAGDLNYHAVHIITLVLPCVSLSKTLYSTYPSPLSCINKYQFLLGANLQGKSIDSHPLNTTETGDKLRPYEPLGSGKDLTFLAHITLFFIRKSDF